MQTPDQALDAYLSMWNTADEDERRALAEQALTDDADVLYPTIEAHGRAEALAAAQRWHQDYPEIRLALTSGITPHHGWLLVSWHIVNADGSPGQGGQNVGQLAEDGRFRRMVGFIGPLPARN